MSLRLPAPERKDQILDVALRVFAERGFHETSMNDVAEAAGITKPVVYQHFASKSALFLEIIDEVGREMITSVTSASSSQGDGRTKTELGVIAFFQWVAAYNDSFRFLFDSGVRTDPEFATAIQKVLDSMAEAIAPLISNTIAPERLDLLAHGVVGTCESVARHLIVHRTSFDPQEVGRMVAELVWGGLREVVG
ncbi:MAG: TetR/AcrR family transcriptional regulator [Ilumatobacteraceae bacterium]